MVTTAPVPLPVEEGPDIVVEPGPALDKEELLAPNTPARAGFFKYQPEAEALYTNLHVQIFVAGLIFANFIQNIVQAQIDPTGKKMADGFAWFELFFNVAFLFELVLNMYGTWLCRFWNSGWNCFDFSVVLIGWMFQLQVPLPGPMKLLRMMRAFRVFRLFKRIESLRKIMSSLARAVPGVMNAFLIQLIIICIFAIIGVDRFRDYGEGGFYWNEMDQKVQFKTARGQDFGFEYFGDFGKALFTMFQVLTGESWAEAITRPLFNSNSPTTSMGSAFFFVLFCILNGVVLINVVVAVLLEKMVDPEEEPEEGEEEEAPPPVADPMVERTEATMAEVAEMKKQMEYIANVTAAMRKQMADVDIVKAQVAALLANAGLEASCAAQPNDAEPSTVDSSAAKFPQAEAAQPEPEPSTSDGKAPQVAEAMAGEGQVAVVVAEASAEPTAPASTEPREGTID